MSGIRSRGATSGRRDDPPAALAARIKRLRRTNGKTRTGPNEHALSDASREVLRSYRQRASSGAKLGTAWRRLAREALAYLGGQSDRSSSTLADYDHHRDGPFLGVSDEGSSASAVRAAALAAPKAVALGSRATPLRVGVALDAERLGGVGEVPVGPDEFAEIWTGCTGRTLITTNVGARANLRFYRRAPVIAVPDADTKLALDAAKTAMAAAFKPFLEAPGGSRPLIVFAEFPVGSKRPIEERQQLLRALLDEIRRGGIADPSVHQLGLNVRIGWDEKGRDAAIAAIDLAKSAGVEHVSIDGVVRKDADQAISLAGLLNYLQAPHCNEVLQHARASGIKLRPINDVDEDTVARDVWSRLNTARAMGLDLGKYGLVPLTLEECDRIVGQVQHWVADWCAAPVFYVDQGLVGHDQVYAGADIVRGIEAWLRVVARHKVRVVLIDTVDKSLGWRILKTNNDPKGLLTADEIASLNTLAATLGIRALWAGGITIEQAYEFGKLGVFGIYVTTAASAARRVGRDYHRDPAVAAEKEPTRAGVLKVKTLLEAGFLSAQLARPVRGQSAADADLVKRIAQAELDDQALAGILPDAWRAWWARQRRQRGR